MRITIEELRALNACKEQFKIFRREWPNGMAVTRKNVLRMVELGLDTEWVALRLLPDPLLAEYSLQEAPRWAEYERQAAMRWAKYNQQEALTWAEHERRGTPRWAEYKRQGTLFWTEYKRQRALRFWRLSRGKGQTNDE